MNSIVRKRRSEPSRSAPEVAISFIDYPPANRLLSNRPIQLILNPAYQVSYPELMCTLARAWGGHGSEAVSCVGRAGKASAGHLRASASGPRQANLALLHAADRRTACRLADRSPVLRRAPLSRGLARAIRYLAVRGIRPRVSLRPAARLRPHAAAVVLLAPRRGDRGGRRQHLQHIP